MERKLNFFPNVRARGEKEGGGEESVNYLYTNTHEKFYFPRLSWIATPEQSTSLEYCSFQRRERTTLLPT